MSNADNAHSLSAQYLHLEAHTYRKRQMSWSRAVRSAAGIGAELPDEVVAAADEGRVVAVLTPVGWEQVREGRLALRSLEVLERDGWAAVAALWEAHGVEWLEAAL